MKRVMAVRPFRLSPGPRSGPSAQVPPNGVPVTINHAGHQAPRSRILQLNPLGPHLATATLPPLRAGTWDHGG